MRSTSLLATPNPDTSYYYLPTEPLPFGAFLDPPAPAPAQVCVGFREPSENSPVWEWADREATQRFVHYYPLVPGTGEVSEAVMEMSARMHGRCKRGESGLVEWKGAWYKGLFVDGKLVRGAQVKDPHAPIDMEQVMNKDPTQETPEPLTDDFLAAFAGLSTSTDMEN